MAQPQRVTPVASVDPSGRAFAARRRPSWRQEPQLARSSTLPLLEHDTLTARSCTASVTGSIIRS